MIQFETVVVPLDGSPLAEKALPFACDLAVKYSAKLLLLRVRTVPPAMLDFQGVPALEAMHDHEKSLCLKYLDEMSASLSKAEPSVPVETAQHVGNPADAILETVKRLPNAMIVITSHGRDGMRRWLMGSVAEKVARHASCPVIIVRNKEEELQ